MKQVIDLRPVYHRLEDRIRAHVILCWLALLLVRVIETTHRRDLADPAPRPGPPPRRRLHRPGRHLPPAHRPHQGATRHLRQAPAAPAQADYRACHPPLTRADNHPRERRFCVRSHVPAGQHDVPYSRAPSHLRNARVGGRGRRDEGSAGSSTGRSQHARSRGMKRAASYSRRSLADRRSTDWSSSAPTTTPSTSARRTTCGAGWVAEPGRDQSLPLLQRTRLYARRGPSKLYNALSSVLGLDELRTEPGETLPGWYAELTRPLPSEGVI